MITPSPICPTCGQPATLALAAPTEQWECANEACPEFGQVLSADRDRQDNHADARLTEVDQETS